ncbi:MAG: hypothetical protein ABJN24_01065 [Hyphomicrobiales bacterium]
MNNSLNASIQQVLDQLGIELQIISVNCLSHKEFWAPIDAKALQSLMAHREAPKRVSSAETFLALCFDAFETKIIKHWDVDELDSIILYAFKLIILESQIANKMPISLSPIIAQWFSHKRDHLVTAGLKPKMIDAAIAAALTYNIRELVDVVCQAVFFTSGINILENLNLTLPKRYLETRPDIIKDHQEDSRPLQYWLESDGSGPLLFIVYYSGRCTYLKCFGCALPSLSSVKAIAPNRLFEQTDHVLERLLSQQERESLKSVFLSNNGSIFDKTTFSPTALHHAIVRSIALFPKLEKIVMETRAEFVTAEDLAHLKQLKKDMNSKVRFEMALGVEVFNERIRNKVAKKGLSNKGIERFIALLGQYDIDLRCYFMLKPHPSMSDMAAYQDVREGLDFLDDIGVSTNTRITMHLNPTYAAIGTDLEAAFLANEYRPPQLSDLETFVEKNKNRHTRIHLGLNDEGLAIEGGSFLREDSSSALSELRRHNMI